MTLPNFNDPVIAARAWADEVERNQKMYKSLENTDYTMGFRELCRSLNAKESVVRKILLDHKWMYKFSNRWLAKGKTVKKGYMTKVEQPISDKFSIYISEFTMKGRRRIRRMLEEME